MSAINELLELYKKDKDVALVYDSFAEIERVYRESMIAMGQMSTLKPTAANSANIALSVGTRVSTTNQPITLNQR